jgi:hypothetical protein
MSKLAWNGIVGGWGQVLKVWWQDATLFVYFSYFITYIHSITFIQYIYPTSFAEASLHLFIACKLSGKNLPVVSSRESNSGLPYSKPTYYQLSHAAPSFKRKLHILNVRGIFR